MLEPTIIAAIGLVFLSGGALAWVAVADGRRVRLRQRLSQFHPAATQPEPESTASVRRPEKRRQLLFLPSNLLSPLNDILAATGHSIGLFHLLATSLIGIAVAGVFGFMLGLSQVSTFVLVIAGGLLAPTWLVRNRQFRYRRQFVESFPDGLDLIVRGVRAGLPVLGAMGVCADEIPGTVGSEMRQMLDQMSLGVDMEAALQQAAARIRVPDFWFFVVALTLQRRTGGALAETLGNLSGLIRRRKEIRVRTRALTAEAKASTIILALLPICVAGLLFLVSGDQMRDVIADRRGRFLLGLAAALLLGGIFTMVAMVKRATR